MMKPLTCTNLSEAAKHRNEKKLLMVRELDFDLGSLKLLADKKKACLLFDLSTIINSHGIRRSIEMAKLRTCLHFCNKYGTYYAFVQNTEDEFMKRSESELVSIAMLLGINRGQAEFALAMPKHYTN